MSSERILVVEDHRDSLELLKTQLKFLGWEVVPVNNLARSKLSAVSDQQAGLSNEEQEKTTQSSQLAES